MQKLQIAIEKGYDKNKNHELSFQTIISLAIFLFLLSEFLNSTKTPNRCKLTQIFESFCSY